MMFDELTRTITRATRKTIHEEGARAVVGNFAGLIYPVTEGGATILSRVWITYLEGDTPTQEAIVNNGGVPAAIGAPVRIVERNNTVYAIPDKFGGRTVVFTGGGSTLTEPHGWTHRRLGIDPRYVEGLAFEPLLVRPSDPPALTVYVEPGRYLYAGQPVQWRGGDSGSLSSYVPVSDDGSINYIAVCLDTNTNTIAIVDGGTAADGGVLFPAQVTYDEIDALVIPSTYLGLALVELTYGQTTILPTHITYDLRTWGGISAAAVSTGAIMIDANGDIMIDASGNIMVGA